MVFVVSRTLVSLPPSAGPPLDLGLAMAAPRVSLLLIAHSMRCFAPPSASMMPFICSVVLQDPPLGDGLFAPTVTPEVGGSGVNSSAAEASQRGPPAASLGPINTNFPRRFLCCLLPLPIQCMHKPKRELVNFFV